MPRHLKAAMLCAVLVSASGCIAFPRVAFVPKVSGRVVSAADQAPLSGALVTAYWSFWSEAVGHGTSHGLADDYCVTDADGRFAFPGKVFCFMHYVGIAPMMWTELNDIGLTVYAGPLYRGCSEVRTPGGEILILRNLDEMQTGQVTWPITPVNVAKRYLAYYEGIGKTVDGCALDTGGPKHPQYQRLMELRSEMERKAAEWRERLKTAQNYPVLDHAPPP